jgi:ParB/RepB/Spo0J family partition protein
MNLPKIGFEPERIVLRLEQILPVRHIKDPAAKFVRYAAIVASIKEVGVIEPLMVYPAKGNPGNYLLLDGHLRYCALKELEIGEVECLIAKEDESFTYNAKINRLSPIQEHTMIMKAVKNGVTPERIAAALNLSLQYVRSNMTLLTGIHSEAIDLLKDKQISPGAIRILKRVNAVRQIEMAEMMVSMNTYAKGYVEAIFLATPKEQLTDPETPKEGAGNVSRRHREDGVRDGGLGARFQGDRGDLRPECFKPHPRTRLREKASGERPGGALSECSAAGYFQ